MQAAGRGDFFFAPLLADVGPGPETVADRVCRGAEVGVAGRKVCFCSQLADDFGCCAEVVAEGGLLEGEFATLRLCELTRIFPRIDQIF